MERPADIHYLELAARQYGVVSRADLLSRGLSASAIWRRVQSGALEELRRYAYRVAGSPRCWEQELMAVQVWAGPEVRISHRAAARLMGFDGFSEDLLEITTTRRLKAPDVVIHQVSELRSYDRRFMGPLVVATAARTLLDLGAVVNIDQVEDALEYALRRRLTTVAALQAGSRALSELLKVRPRDYIPMASRLEIKIDRLLRVTPLPAYVRQFTVRTRVGDRRPDFAFPTYRVAVEGDGYDQHGGRKSWVYDNERHRALEALGWDVIHVTWDDLRHRRNEFIQDLHTKLIRKGWTPPPTAAVLPLDLSN